MLNKDPPAFNVPKHLRKDTQAWIKSLISEFELEEHHFKLLVSAAESWDRICAAREVIDAQGMTYTDRFGQPKARPEIAIERDNKVVFARLLRELALDGDDSPEAPRMARTADYGRRR
ncbi:P27 family phage terminase small subunit [Bosea sp. NPDC055332]